jgi:hypothetical protein
MSNHPDEQSRLRSLYAAPLLTGDVAIDQKVLVIAEGRASAVLFMAKALDMLDIVEDCDDFEDLENAELLLVAVAKKAAADAQVG